MTGVNRLRALLGEDTTVLLDGGMGTLLQENGLDDGGSGELWNVERPDVIEKIHEAYAEAGARLLTTNTFGGTRPRLAMHGLEDRRPRRQPGRRRDRHAGGPQVRRVRRRRPRARPASCWRPSAPWGRTTRERCSRSSWRGLRDGGIDVVLIETMSDLGEVVAAVEAARRVVPDAPVIATLSFDTNLRSMMGVRPADAVAALAEAGVDAVGANCGRGPEEMEIIAAELVKARAGDVLIVAQSNAGLPQLVGDRFEYDAPPEELADHARALRDLGVDLIGACCGSTPAHVAAMNRALLSLHS